MSNIPNFRKELIAARLRTFKMIAVAVESGVYQVQEIIPKGSTSEVIPMSEWVSDSEIPALLSDL